MLRKKEAIQIFEQSRLPATLQDATALRCAWNDYVDGLQKDGHITARQAENWTNPYDRSQK